MNLNANTQPYQPFTNFKNDQLKGGTTNQLSNTENLYELTGVGFNRWEPLFFDPQKNCIEPFRRVGENTVLFSLDKHVSECGNK